jgi:hypothetical protein
MTAVFIGIEITKGQYPTTSPKSQDASLEKRAFVTIDLLCGLSAQLKQFSNH